MTTLASTNTALKSPLEMLYGWEKNQPNKVFQTQPLANETKTWTWGQFADQVRRMAAAIQAKGYEPGTKIGILSKNCAHWMMSDLAIMMSGHISVPIYPNVNSETVEYVLTHSEAKMLFVGKLEPHDWATMKKGIPAGIECVNYGIYELANASEYPTWDQLTTENGPLEGNPNRDLEEVMTIIYTSGTTGRPKGVVLKFVSPVFAMETFYDVINMTPEDRFFSYLPMSHIAERMLITMGTLRSGGSVNFAHSLDTFARDLGVGKPTIFLGVPRIWAKFQSGVLAKFPQSRLNLLLSIPIISGVIKGAIKKALGLNKARICLTGAAPIPVSTLEWYKKLDLRILEVYGMTENSAYSHSNLPNAFKFGSVGQTMRECETKITEEGEICVKSIANMVEYYKDPEKTAATLRDGWLHTGDKGKFDSEGYLRITGRVKDIFKTSKAKYVAPNPIEMLFSKNEYVEQVCVVGTGIPQPLALVVLSEDGRKRDPNDVKASIESTLGEVNPKLEHHERLQKAVIVKEEWTTENGMLTPTLKIKRGSIDDKYQTNYENWYEGGKGVVFE